MKICFELYKLFSNQELARAHMEILEADYKPWDISKGGMMI